MARPIAAQFIYKFRDRFVDEYTNTQVIGSGAELQALLSNPNRGAIYVIGNGEVRDEERTYFEGEGIQQALASSEFKRIFVGRDHNTTVLFAPPPQASMQMHAANGAPDPTRSH
jgi:hypothetical protein